MVCGYNPSLEANSGMWNLSAGVELTGIGASDGTRMDPPVTPWRGPCGSVAARLPQRGGAPAGAPLSPSAWPTSSPRCSWLARSTLPAPSHLHPNVLSLSLVTSLGPTGRMIHVCAVFLSTVRACEHPNPVFHLEFSL
jgi:hypothetical protein